MPERSERRAHQMMHSFVGKEAPDWALDGVRSGRIPGFCLFRHNNVDSPAQLREMNLSLWRAALDGGLPPPLIGIDQEGGQLVAVTGGATELPGNMALAATRDPALAEAAGRILGRELLAMGVNLNFAPSLDVNINPANPVIGVRSFGDDPALVAEMGVALLCGMQAEGVIAAAKHFPGHGDTAADSHYAAPSLPHSRERIEQVELAPFRAAIRAGVGALLTAHVRLDALDAARPATLSPAVLGGLLRGEMGFSGLIITDAMDMHAVAQFGALQSVSGAMDAGADLILLGHLPDQMALSRATHARIHAAALARIRAARERLPRHMPPLSVVGCDAHRRIERAIAERSITRVKGDPLLRPGPDDVIAVVTPEPRDLTPADTSSSVQIALADAIRARHPHVHALQLCHDAGDADIAALRDACRGASIVVVGAIDAARDPAQRAFVDAIRQDGARMVIISMRTPYDLAALPFVETYLCTYSIRAASMWAVARVLFGDIDAAGKLPCRIPGIALDA
ncbi:MAG: glycoside hydrolase family 3 protein [Anaerolineae bacterium]|nr:glycoside hydrolase family 3 protein [Anaerolineae bacterium]